MVPAPRETVFGWHERAGALRRLTPPWQPVSVAGEPSSLRDGQAVLRAAGLRWVAQHSGYEPPRQFVDELVSLPLRWRHHHEFEALSEGATRVTDRVDTPVPAGLLRATFRYRHRQLAADLAAHHWAQWYLNRPLTVAVTGSSGMVGTALTAFLTTGGHRVIRLVRRRADGPDERTWHPDDPDPGLLQGVDAVIHLAGASIAGRFTERHKRGIRDSRVGPTRKLAELVARAERPPTLVTASAIGYYGTDRADTVLTEDSAQGEGFLAKVVADWEAATAAAAEAGARVVNIRTGGVQTPSGGTLRLLHPLFAAGLGGPIGDGHQWTSWIGIDDLLEVYHRALVDQQLSGPVNAVSPHPQRNADYSRTLASVLGRPAAVPTPPIGPRLLLGAEGAAELAKASQRVRPARLLSAAHRFRYPELSYALRHVLGKPLPE